MNLSTEKHLSNQEHAEVKFNVKRNKAPRILNTLSLSHHYKINDL